MVVVTGAGGAGEVVRGGTVGLVPGIPALQNDVKNEHKTSETFK